jgi:hypothetical protein
MIFVIFCWFCTVFFGLAGLAMMAVGQWMWGIISLGSAVSIGITSVGATKDEIWWRGVLRKWAAEDAEELARRHP